MLRLVRRLEKASTNVMPLASLHSPPFSSAPFPPQPHAMASAAATSDLASDVTQQKRSLRMKIRRDLRSLPLPQRRFEDTAIQNVVLDSLWFKRSTRLCAYISCESLREVDTSRILSTFLNTLPDDRQTQNNRMLYVPLVEDNNSNMRMLRISNMEDLVANSMNILEPSPIDALGNKREDVFLADDPVDVIILPGVAFDKCGRRLGRGGGYYDVFLRKYQEISIKRKWRPPLLVALAYSLQIMDEGIIPLTAHDVLIDAFVSPAGVTRISPSALERM